MVSAHLDGFQTLQVLCFPESCPGQLSQQLQTMNFHFYAENISKWTAINFC